MKQREFITLLGGAVVAWTLAGAVAPDVSRIAVAQSYPSRPINVIVSFPPGGNTDIMARALQNEMSTALSQTVVIINKPGATGTLGLIELSRAAPDGYTIALTPNNPLTAQPHVQKLPYALDSFRYVCLTYFAPYVLIAGPQAPFKTFHEFVTFAKAKPENLIYGHAGVASQPHLGMLAVLKAIGAEGLGVPFTGAGPMAQALLSGTVMAISETPAVAAASNLPVLAALSEARIAALPDVRTMKELGFPAASFTAGGEAELFHRAHVGQRGDARFGQCGKNRQIARRRDGRRFGNGHHGAAEQRLRHRTRAGERHAQPLGCDRLEYGEHAEMRLTGDARVAVDEVFGLCLGEADEFVECLERRLGSGD